MFLNNTYARADYRVHNLPSGKVLYRRRANFRYFPQLTFGP